MRVPGDARSPMPYNAVGMTGTDENVLSFWGKARPLAPGRGPERHPLAFHCLDVAAVGEALLARHRGLGDGLFRLLGLPQDRAAPLVPFLLCLHDIGKFAKRFQAKEPLLYPACFADDPQPLPYDHGAGGLRLFDADGEAFRLPCTGGSRAWRPLISAVAGHHGAPPTTPQRNETRVTLRGDFGAQGIEAACAFIREAHGLFSLPQSVPPLDDACARRASFALAGLAVLADWIGSNQTWFPYRDPEGFEDLEAYWRDARKRAGKAVAESGVPPAASRGRGCLGYDVLIEEGAIPSPMQDWMRMLELPDGPALFTIEDETGSGKTEAALMLAHRLMAAGRADGLYLALPTMATANAMFDRLGKAYRALFAAEAAPSLALAHGSRDMHDGFRSAVLRGGRAEAPYSGAGGADDDSETTASASCAAWIADDRRLAFLADAGAGTVDQALLAVLPNRHQSLRLLGLMRRVLVFDEVHAYDAYMRREIEALLEFQAGLGGSAILLSATLPRKTREWLANAFSRGLGERSDAPTAPDGGGPDYPLVAVRAAGVRTCTKVAGRSVRSRTLPLRFLRTEEEALAAVEREARAGKAVLYIRNTVDDALDAYEALMACGLRADLFHARFALVDRLKIERRIMSAFGKESELADRTGKVLVATQVVEQSLDLDFDAMVTDLAPVDLVIQRAGRLWRHHRPDRWGQPELLVVGPTPDSDAGEDWFANAFPRAAHVYRDHARLWLTARALENAEAIESPGGLRALVEAVYGDDSEACVPEGLKSRFFDAEGRAGAERGIATTNVLKLSTGYVRDGGAWDRDVRTPTRLDDDPGITLRLARLSGGRVAPYARDTAPDQPWRAWRLSEVNVPARRVGDEVIPPGYADAVCAAKADWTRLDDGKRLVLLVDAGEGAMREALTADITTNAEASLWYSPATGLHWRCAAAR